MDHADRSATLQSWVDSSDAYIAFQDAGDRSRTELLDPIMLQPRGQRRGERVLDLGCGEGRFCRMLGERGADTAGIDPIERMIEIARSRDAHGGTYVRAAAEILPFGDASFDLVVSYVTLVNIVGFREAIAESARVLAAGGRIRGEPLVRQCGACWTAMRAARSSIARFRTTSASTSRYLSGPG